MIYFIVPIALSIIGANIPKGRNNKRIYIICSFIILWLLLGLRDQTVGNDTEEYGRIYISLQNYDNFFASNPRFEYGYVLLCRFLGLLNINVQGMYLIMAGIIMIPIAVIVCRRSYKPWLSILLFCVTSFYLDLFSAMRGAFALAFALMAIDAVVRKKPIAYLFWVLLATLFHNIGIFLLILYPLSLLKLNNTSILVYFTLSLIALVAMPLLINVALKIVPQYSYYFADSQLDLKISVFANFAMVAFLFVMVKNTGTEYLACVTNNRSLYTRKCRQAGEDVVKSGAYTATELREGKIYLLAIVIALCIEILEFRVPLLERVANMFYYSSIISVPFFAHYIKSKGKKAVFTWGIVIAFILKTVLTLAIRPEWLGILPYKFFWSVL